MCSARNTGFGLILYKFPFPPLALAKCTDVISSDSDTDTNTDILEASCYGIAPIFWRIIVFIAKLRCSKARDI